MTEPKREGRLERLEKVVGDINLTLRTFVDAFRQERTAAQRERNTIRGKIEKLVHAQGKIERAVDEVKAEVKAETSEIKKDVAEMKPVTDAAVIKGHRDEGKRALLRKQWGVVVVAASIFVWLIGEVRDWWPKLFGK